MWAQRISLVLRSRIKRVGYSFDGTEHSNSSRKPEEVKKKTMARICFVFLVIAAAILLVDSQSTPVCPENEEWKSCGTACEPSCSNPNPQICTLQCVIECQCKSGFLRNSEGRCVQPCEC